MENAIKTKNQNHCFKFIIDSKPLCFRGPGLYLVTKYSSVCECILISITVDTPNFFSLEYLDKNLISNQGVKPTSYRHLSFSVYLNVDTGKMLDLYDILRQPAVYGTLGVFVVATFLDLLRRRKERFLMASPVDLKHQSIELPVSYILKTL